MPTLISVHENELQTVWTELDRSVALDGSVFGKLMNSAAKCARGCPKKDAARRLRVHHRRSLLRWLSLNVEEQVADLEHFLANQAAGVRLRLIERLRNGLAETLLPIEVSAHERMLFLSDFEIVLDLVQADTRSLA
jgi:hypothetical protein